MKKKLLSEEIIRIRELMGNKLINEQWASIAKFVAKNTDEFAELVGKYADDFTKLGKEGITDSEAIEVLAKLANAERKFADVIVPQVMKNLPDDVSKEIGQIIAFAEDQIKKGVPKDVVTGLVEKRLKAIQTPFEGVRTIIKKNIDDTLSGYKPPAPNPPSPDVDDTLKQQMRDTFANWDELAPGKLSTKDKILLNDLWFRGLRAKINYLLNSLMNTIPSQTQKSLDKIVSLIKEQARLGEDFAAKKEIYKAIDAEIEALRKNEDFVKEKVYGVIKQEVDKKLGAGKGYDLVAELKKNDTLAPDAQSYWSHLINDTYIGKMLPSFKKTGEKMSGVKDFVHRTIMTVTTGNPRKVGEVFDEFFRKYGTVNGFFRWYAFLWVVHRTIWPLFLSEIDTLFGYAFSKDPNLKFDSWWDANKYFFKERFLDMFMPVVEEFNATTGKYEKTGERKLDFTALQAFQWFWDEIDSGLDWHVAGGTRRMFEHLYETGKEKFENVEVPNVENPFSIYKDKPESFVDFLIDAGYSPEVAEKATQDPTTKYYLTPDGKYKYKFEDGTFNRVTE